MNSSPSDPCLPSAAVIGMHCPAQLLGSLWNLLHSLPFLTSPAWTPRLCALGMVASVPDTMHSQPRVKSPLARLTQVPSRAFCQWLTASPFLETTFLQSWDVPQHHLPLVLIPQCQPGLHTHLLEQTFGHPSTEVQWTLKNKLQLLFLWGTGCVSPQQCCSDILKFI